MSWFGWDGRSMDHSAASTFARAWARDWNSHDLDAILGHFTDDVVFTSPIAAQMLDGSDGALRGKDELRSYWAKGLERIPDLHFAVEAVYAGVTTVVINYRNHTGALVCEVLRFDGSLVAEGHGTYLSDDAAGASGVLSP
jgi:ketosteroid isomerase-like protein